VGGAGAELQTLLQRGDAEQAGRLLAREPALGRKLSAELNSIACMLEQDLVSPLRLFLFTSDTREGRLVGAALHAALEAAFKKVEMVCVKGLQDADARRFRRVGLRELARLLARPIGEYGAEQCAINATGGYKAQIAVAVLVGQALGIPVYYLFERFPEIISFPPLPVALDLTVWSEYADVFHRLADRNEEPETMLGDALRPGERLEPLLERVDLDGVPYVALSPIGQVLHEAALQRYGPRARAALPPRAERKLPPREEDSGHVYPEARAWMQRLTDEVPYVVRCATFYSNPDLPCVAGFRLSSHALAQGDLRGGIEGTWSNGTAAVRFRVETTVTSRPELEAAVADLNRWCAERP
jgi:putative CRISPR-associated protein (TIGR02619 family)